MIMLGNIVNTVAIIGGSILGIFFKKGLPLKIKDIIMSSMGLFLLTLAIKDAIKFNNAIFTLACLLLGAVIGEFLMIDDNLKRLGTYFEEKFSNNDNSSNDIVKGFTTTSIMFCVGAMAIVGSIKSGLTNDNEILLIKALLDGIFSLIFASKYGIGVLFSSIVVFLYQGSLYFLAFFIKSSLSENIITEISTLGGIIMIGLAFNLLFDKNIKIGNMVPALFIPIIYNAIFG
ncbi:MAG: DUF554 domain-containing protein [Fusobacterium gastrosuis]|uniref:DUF554 domain-containing protein n=1 Tax=Fusobacterium gastrosuis TaxID=1755100 RepID=UPI002A93E99C|nr:DUF554 domain-containing protein [Fusobacteriaceae bacterium]MDY5794370.1 DUF554 domain-containing protein [Fusobacterium gastrosuis]